MHRMPSPPVAPPSARRSLLGRLPPFALRPVAALATTLAACATPEDVAGEAASPVLPELDGSPPTRTLVPATDGDALVVATFDVNVGDPGSLFRVDADGTRVDLGALPSGGWCAGPFVAGEAPRYAYVGTNHGIHRVAPNGGGAFQAATTTGSVHVRSRAFAATATSLLVGTSGGEIWSVAPSFAEARQLTTSLPPVGGFTSRDVKAIWAKGARVVWADALAVHAADVGEGVSEPVTPRTLTSEPLHTTTAASEDAVFALRGDGPRKDVVRVPMDGAPPTTLLQGIEEPMALAADATHLWVSQLDTAERRSVVREYRLTNDGKASGPREIARTEHSIEGLYVTSSHVVWVDRTDRRFRRVPKG